MKVLYVRVSSVGQKLDRQTVIEKEFNYVVEDKCSGAISFFDRQGGKEIQKLISKKAITSLSVVSIDRLGRNLIDILNTIKYFNEKLIPITFLSQGLTTLDSEGKENTVCKLMIGILATVADLERIQIRERQMEGIQIAKAKGNVFLGRKAGSIEDSLKFLSKPKNKQALDYMKKGYALNEISKIVGVHANTLTKIKKIGLQNV